MTADDVEFLASVTEKLKARDVDEQALTYQFLEWKAQKLNDNPDVKQLLARLKEVDTHLVSSTFLCGERLTAVDILLTKTLGQFLDHTRFDPRGKVLLAPMVRVSTHPMRLLALKYGADYVFCEEIVDLKILKCTRMVNETLNTVDFLSPDGSVTFRTSPEEKGRVFVQLGTAEADKALAAAKILEQDVFGIDVNMGCPKDYSIKGGMGSALLTKPDKVKEILTNLTSNLKCPVTCKIRILPKLEDTLALARLIESTGVAALTVHGRTPSERPQNRNHDEVIRAIADTLSIPVIANGGSRDTIRMHEDIEFFRQQTNAAGVMIARAAMWNPAIFQSNSMDRPAPQLHDLIKEYLKIAVRYDHHINGVKYCIGQMLHLEGTTELFRDTVESKDIKELCDIWGMDEFYEEEKSRRTRAADLKNNKRLSPLMLGDEPPSEPKRTRTGEHNDETCAHNGEVAIVRRCIPFERRFWPVQGDSPKQILHEHCQKNNLKPPTFETIEDREARLFYCTMTLEDKRFHNTSGCKSKKFAEQAAALVYLDFFGLPTGKCSDEQQDA